MHQTQPEGVQAIEYLNQITQGWSPNFIISQIVDPVTMEGAQLSIGHIREVQEHIDALRFAAVMGRNWSAEQTPRHPHIPPHHIHLARRIYRQLRQHGYPPKAARYHTTQTFTRTTY